MQFGDATDVEVSDTHDPALDPGVVRMFAVTEQIDSDATPGPVIRQTATSIESAPVPDIRPTTRRAGLWLRSRRSEERMGHDE